MTPLFTKTTTETLTRMNTSRTWIALAAMSLSLSFTASTQAQTAHYPNGVEGIKASSLPPAGIYVRDYNYCYFANEFPGGPADFNATAYVQGPRGIWITDQKVLGGTYGASVLVPFVYQDISVGATQQQKFGLGDLMLEPLLLSWNVGDYDFALGYGLWTPTGDFQAGRLVNPGKGYFGHMLSLGASRHFGEDKSWTLTALNRYEINHENPDTDITTGDAWTIEGGLSKTLSKSVEVGAIGYVQAKVTPDSGPVAPRDSIAGFGPEVSVLIPGIDLFASVRYAFEFAASDRPEGHLLNVTFTKRF